MKTRFLGAACGCAFTLAVSLSANAALVDRGGGLIYDTDLNITWLANANVDNVTWPGGVMTWPGAIIWVSDLSYYDSVRNVTYTDWRLPTTLQPDASCSIQGVGGDSYGYNCTGSEMGHLFYNELGGTAGSSILSSTDPDLALFTNVQPSWYWSSTESQYGDAWGFNFSLGYQNTTGSGGYAWAVRSGDVAAVPVPAAVWLFGSGLLGLIGMSRRKTA